MKYLELFTSLEVFHSAHMLFFIFCYDCLLPLLFKLVCEQVVVFSILVLKNGLLLQLQVAFPRDLSSLELRSQTACQA